MGEDAGKDSPTLLRTGQAESTESASTPGAEQTDDLIGRHILQFHVVARLGEGGMGVVYKAIDEKLRRRVAIKVLGKRYVADERNKELIFREARSAAAVSHPNVAAIYDVSEASEIAFIVMELVEGQTLRARVAGGRVSTDEALHIAREIAAGLDAAHRIGVVHRDLKPDNIMLTGDGHVKLLDFGLAKQVSEDGDALDASEGRSETTSPAMELSPTLPAGASRTRDGRVVGTPAYMSPEQAHGEQVDARADVFSFGVVLHELLTGKAPFSHRTKPLRDWGDASSEDWRPAVPLRAERPDVSPELAAVIARCMDASAVHRYASAAELVLALATVRVGRRRRGGWIAGGVVAGGVALAGAFGLWRSQISHSEASRPTAGSSFAPVSIRDVPEPVPDVGFRPRDFRRLTFDEGCEEFPTFTADGRSVIFNTKGVESSLVAIDVTGGARRTLTTVHGQVFAASVSPDGSQIAYVRAVGGNQATYVLPVDATPAVDARFVGAGGVRPSWSRDGKAIWAGDHKHFTEYAVDSGQVLRSLDAPTGYWSGQSVELADGRLVVVFPYAADALAGAVGVYARDGALTHLLDGNLVEVLALMPGGEKVLVSRRLETGTRVPVAVPLDGKPATALVSAGMEPAKGLQFSRDGAHLVFSNCKQLQRLVDVAPDGAVTPLFPDADWSDYDVTPIPGSSLIAVVSERDGQLRPWLIDRAAGGAPPRAIDTGVARPQWLAASTDGKLLALSTAPSGIYLAEVAGTSAAHQLTHDATDDEPVFDAGDTRVLFRRATAEGRPQVMSIPVGGGDVTPVLPPGSRAVAVSPADGRLVYLAGAKESELVPTLWDRRGARVPLSKELPAGTYDHPVFSANGQRVVLYRSPNTLVEVDVASGHVLHTYDTAFQRATYSGDHLLALRLSPVGDVWLADIPEK